MYNEVYQGKFLSILDAVGVNPLLFYEKQIPCGCIKRIIDEDLNSVAVEITSDNPSINYIRLPDHCHKNLSIFLPIINILIKNMGQPFSFYIEIIDQERKIRKFKFGNCFKLTKHGNMFCSMPITWKYGWNHIVFDLEYIVKAFFGTYYMECKLIEIHANCRLRKIFFSDKEYLMEELPLEYQLRCLNPHDTYNIKKDSKAGSNLEGESSYELESSEEVNEGFDRPIEFIVGENSTMQNDDDNISESQTENLNQQDDSNEGHPKVSSRLLSKQGNSSISAKVSMPNDNVLIDVGSSKRQTSIKDVDDKQHISNHESKQPKEEMLQNEESKQSNKENQSFQLLEKEEEEEKAKSLKKLDYL